MAETFLSSQTDEDFSKARNKALINELQHILSPEEATLISFNDVKSLLKPKNEVYKGMQVIPINLIVGSEGRYKDFDNHFFPKSSFLRKRWEHIDLAHLTDVPLPAISVYEVGGLYFVRDGNHRVSVAKTRGVETIDAEVVSLHSEIKLKPSSTIEQIQKQVINYEKRVFYAETNFGDITDYWCLDFSTTGQYDEIYNHILMHKYYINQTSSTELPFEVAVTSWYENVYLPVIVAMESHHLMRHFKNRTKSDMYVFLIKYWDDLKTRFGNDFSLDKATEDFKREYTKPPLILKLKSFYAKHKVKKSIK